MRNIKRIFVHCTAGSQKQTKNDLLREFKAKGWSAPGYHYVVFPDGRVDSLLAEDKVSNGVQGFNSTAINIAYVGGIDSNGRAIDNRTEAQKEALRSKLTELKKKYPNAHIMGHRDIWGKNPANWKKQCPCFDAEKEYENILEINDKIQALEDENKMLKTQAHVQMLTSLPLFAQPEEPKQSLWSKIKSYFPWNKNK